ncbi:Disks large-associated protein 5 [Bagarius yarrelli]|uniref:Disks large-associated protein 5 n=1 Tax=Bagarius yarrelli TaxID=175774 RepID=A0A556TIT5_BAGYA|nr:Disks large-associated protein 5 [Bagarius yarrelli]
MDSRFAHLYKRDNSVSMIRVKMSRRRSQSQKENREKIRNIRRNLDQLPELELSLDVSTLDKSVVPSYETGFQVKADKKNSAAEERRKMLARFKENKALQKEKEKREKEKKGTFKVGLYRPQPLGYLPLNPAVPIAKKQPAEKQQPALKKAEPITRAIKTSVPAMPRGRIAIVEPVVRAPTTRSAAKALTASVTGKSVAKPAEELRPHRTKAANKQPAVPPSAGHAESVTAEKKETKVAEMITAVKPSSPKEEKVVEDTVTPVSFAPQGFVFQAPSGLVTFQPTPLSPRSADAFLSPSFSTESQTESKNQISPPSDSFSAQPCMSKPCPSSVFTPASSPVFSFVPTDSTASLPASISHPPPASPAPVSDPHDASPTASASISHPPPASPAPYSAPVSDSHDACPSTAPASISHPLSASPTPAPASTPLSPHAAASSFVTPEQSEPQHDVAYFRAIMASETERLTGLSKFWELRFDDSAIPEEMRDRMRTAVGQARLLMKERFGQFSGLVDDCHFGRGERITTCTDLQGFWDMVYFQVEDVDKKFNALKEAETRGWQEEIKPVTRQKRVVKKPPAAGGKPGAGTGASAAARSRLAAVKAAMKAKQAATKAAETSDKAQGDAAPASDVPADTFPSQTVVFHGGFFQVESPVKIVGAVRRSSRLSAAPFTQCSPHAAKFSTPGRQKRSAIVGHSSLYPCATPSKNPPSVAPSPAAVDHTSVLPACTPKQYTGSLPCSPKPLHVSPEQHSFAPCASPNRASHTQLGQFDHNDIQSDNMITQVDEQMNQSTEIKPQNSPCQTEELPLHLPAHSSNNMESEGKAEDFSITAMSQEHTEITEADMLHSDSQSHNMSFSDSASECKTTPKAESGDSCVSVPSSPSKMSEAQTVQVSPAPSDKIDICVNERSPISADCKVTENESLAGLDFERYLQPTARASLSPVQSMAVERFSLGLEDAEMESPQAQTEEPVHDALMTPTAFPRMAPLVVTPCTEEVDLTFL